MLVFILLRNFFEHQLKYVNWISENDWCRVCENRSKKQSNAREWSFFVLPGPIIRDDADVEFIVLTEKKQKLSIRWELTVWKCTHEQHIGNNGEINSIIMRFYSRF